jgi:hypothetical protein
MGSNCISSHSSVEGGGMLSSVVNFRRERGVFELWIVWSCDSPVTLSV